MQVFSNEIRFSSKEELNVRWSDNTTIAKGLWKDIKDEVKANGGHFTKLFYAMSDNLELVCIRIKGNGLLSWGEVVGKSQKKQQSEWISVTGYAEKAFGESINTFPTFNFGGGLTPSEDQVANDLFAELKEYGLIKSSARAESTTATTSSTVSIPESQLQLDPSNDDDDLPF
ncbi:hypothetical protein ASG33_08240 [Dyadobacter sp. Leaf189]|nr:hypothetical protein ASG33_08240 [Dyadobacter sp. Leaf189]